MKSQSPSEVGPYERAIRKLIANTEEFSWPDGESMLAFGGPPWLAMRVACETGGGLTPCSGGNCITTLDGLRVFGCPSLDGPPAGRLVVHDLLSGRHHDLATRCHRDLPPHRWIHLTVALAEGINPVAAVDLAGIAAVS